MAPLIRWPLRAMLPAAIVGALTVGLPGPARPQTTPEAPERTPDASIEGLPIYTSDGKQIGKAIAMGLDENDQPVLVGEIERQLGFGPVAIAVPPDMFNRQADRIALTITEAEVNARLGQ